jgi:hypothetical protein
MRNKMPKIQMVCQLFIGIINVRLIFIPLDGASFATMTLEAFLASSLSIVGRVVASTHGHGHPFISFFEIVVS